MGVGSFGGLPIGTMGIPSRSPVYNRYGKGAFGGNGDDNKPDNDSNGKGIMGCFLIVGIFIAFLILIGFLVYSLDTRPQEKPYKPEGFQSKAERRANCGCPHSH